MGWKPALAIRRPAEPDEPSFSLVFGLVCSVGGLLTLLLLMPDFEDGQGGGWDREEDDES